MITANQINSKTPIADIASFLKFSTPGQFQLLNKEQIHILEIAIDDAYRQSDNLPNQRQKAMAEQMLQLQRKDRNREIAKQEHSEIQKRKNEIKNWWFTYIASIITILIFVSKIKPNKTSQTIYEHDAEGKKIKSITIQTLYWSSWTWIGLGIIATIVIFIGIRKFLNTNFEVRGSNQKIQSRVSEIDSKKKKTN